MITEEKKKAMEEMARKLGHVRQEPGAAGDAEKKRHRVPEQWKTAPNKYENQFMMDLMILKNALAVRAEKVRGRLGMVNPNAWRDLRLLITLVDRIQRELMETMPGLSWGTSTFRRAWVGVAPRSRAAS